jgi:hypothetical protein
MTKYFGEDGETAEFSGCLPGELSNLDVSVKTRSGQRVWINASQHDVQQPTDWVTVTDPSFAHNISAIAKTGQLDV